MEVGEKGRWRGGGDEGDGGDGQRLAWFGRVGGSRLEEKICSHGRRSFLEP